MKAQEARLIAESHNVSQFRKEYDNIIQEIKHAAKEKMGLRLK